MFLVTRIGMNINLNEYLSSQRDESDPNVYENKTFPTAKRIECADGFSLSVQAAHVAYCSPRRNIGPWHEVEVGFPSERPDYIMEYAEDPRRPTDTVYGYVPIELVEKLIAKHGGLCSDKTYFKTTPEEDFNETQN
jgi:hypothetical protein